MACPPNLPACPGVFHPAPPAILGLSWGVGQAAIRWHYHPVASFLATQLAPACLLLPLLPRKATDWRQILTELRHLAHITNPLNLAAALKNQLPCEKAEFSAVLINAADWLLAAPFSPQNWIVGIKAVSVLSFLRILIRIYCMTFCSSHNHSFVFLKTKIIITRHTPRTLSDQWWFVLRYYDCI